MMIGRESDVGAILAACGIIAVDFFLHRVPVKL